MTETMTAKQFRDMNKPRGNKFNRKWPPRTPDELLWFLRTMTTKEVAAIYGMQPVTIKAFLLRRGIRMPKKNWRQSFFEKVDKGGRDECWQWTGATDEKGYGFICTPSGQMRAHRASVEIHRNISVPRGLVVMHACDNPGCVNPEHLSMGTQKENMQDCSNKRRFKSRRGESNQRALLTRFNVIEMRRQRDDGKSVKEIAEHFGVKYHSVWNVISGRTWTWL